ncbi:MAG: hypothetical protein IKN57_03595, partial [Parasporobacterium sp.]|nr:hypothetical protein [Parasporobacterium sp.]
GASHELIAPDSGKRLILLVRHQIVREINGFDSVYNRFYPCAISRNTENVPEHAKMVACLETSMDEYNSSNPLWEACIHGSLILFLVYASRVFLQSSAKQHPQPSLQKQRAYTETFFRVCTYINNHCGDKLTLEETAKVAGFSRS